MTQKHIVDPHKQTSADMKDIEDNKYLAAIGYIWILCLVPLLMKRKSKFAQFHGKQGLVLFIAEVILSFVWIIPILGWIVGFFGYIIVLVLSILGVINAVQGRYWDMPWLGKYTKKLNL